MEKTGQQTDAQPQSSHLCPAASAAVVSRMLTASLLLGGMSSVAAVQSGAGLEDTARHGFRAAVAVTAAEPYPAAG